MEFERQLEMLRTKKSDLEKRVEANKIWNEKYDIAVGPFAQKYNDMTKDISVIYETAKQGHSRGIGLLEKEFGYHPAFKRPMDTFTATSFRPK